MRRERMGHIETREPDRTSGPEVAAVAHRPHARLTFLRRSGRDALLRGVVVIDPGMTSMQRGQLLSDEMYLRASSAGDEFDTRMGAEAVWLQKSLAAGSNQGARGHRDFLLQDQDQARLSAKRLKLLEVVHRVRQQARWMVLHGPTGPAARPPAGTLGAALTDTPT